ncbi:MAG TPA: hypothetical protein VGU72_16335 [Beijerinckiaceae bacterium]|jgi:hypothetical protein|nr:hypothetical protein [Beijerinckiaceae bacterium]
MTNKSVEELLEEYARARSIGSKQNIRLRHFTAYAEEEAKTSLPDSVSHILRNWINLFDEAIGWFALATAVVQRILREWDDVPLVETKRFTATQILIPRVFQDGLAIRALILNGCEPQARVLLRSSLEHLDLLSVISSDEEIADQFLSCKDNSESNLFWNKHIRRGRLLARVIDVADLRINFGAIYSRLRKEENDVHSLFAHPSVLAALCGIFRDNQEDSSVFSRQATEASIRSIHILLAGMMIAAFETDDLIQQALSEQNLRVTGSEGWGGVAKQQLADGKLSLFELIIIANDPENSELFEGTAGQQYEIDEAKGRP